MAYHNHAHHQHRRDRVQNAHQEVRRQDTVVNVVYVTASPTFTGTYLTSQALSPVLLAEDIQKPHSYRTRETNTESILHTGKIGGYKTMDGSEEDTSPQPVAVPKTTSPVAKASPTVLAQASQPEQEEQPSTSTTPVAVVKTTQQTQPTPTQEPSTTQQSTQSSKATPKVVTSQAVSSSITSSKSVSKEAPESTSTTLSETLVPTTHVKSSSLPSSTLEATSVASPFNAQSASTSSPTAVAVTEKSSSGGMSGGAKAGLAIGILLAVGVLAALIFFCVRRRRTHHNEAYGKTLDEKAALGGEGAAVGLARSASVQTATTSRTAPRLSLRPVTQFLPDLAAQRKSGGNLLAVAGGQARHNAPASNGADLEIAAMGNQPNNPANPFGNHAAISDQAPIESRADSATNPFSNHAEISRQLTNIGPEPEIVAPAPLRIRTPTPDGKSAAEAGAVAVGAAGAMAIQRQDSPKPLNLSPNRAASPAMSNYLEGGMPSPAGTEFSMTPASPGSYPQGHPPSNVHRIQLDFKPSMDDELSLRAGQLVRLLHEYDDGWVCATTVRLH